MRIRSNAKAGGFRVNRCEQTTGVTGSPVTHDVTRLRIHTMRVRTDVKAGGRQVNRCEQVARRGCRIRPRG
jgi:hypothetical protein